MDATNSLISIIIPTYNEKSNLPILCQRINNAMHKDRISYNIIVVDDNSPDGTAERAKELANTYPITIIKRMGKKGLGSAIIDGINAAAGQVICVMDADLSHPPETLPPMLNIITSGQAQMVVGSRYVKDGGTSKWIWYRKLIGLIAKKAGAFLTPVKDITSGFFMFDRSVICGIKLEPLSWKMGLEIMVKGKASKIMEYPIIFIEREHGQSKMHFKEAVAYFWHLLHLIRYKLSNKETQ